MLFVCCKNTEITIYYKSNKNLEKIFENGDFMNKKEIAKKVIIESGGIAKTVSLNKAGIQNFEIVKLCEQGEIERVRHGYYQITMNNDVSDEQMIATFFDEAIICMESALFYYGYSDHTPLAWTLAVPRSMTRSKMNIDTFAYKLYFIQNDQHQIGKEYADFNGIKLPIYDRERIICDCFKYRTKMDSELFNKAINAYVSDEKKNLGNLSKYAKEMRVYKKVNELMGVMLNG